MNKNQTIILSTVISAILIASSIVLIVLFIPQKEGLIQHGPIIILDDSDFDEYNFKGDGIFDNPYIIQKYNITTISTNGIYIRNTTKHFVIRDCYINAKGSGIFIETIANNSASILNNNCTNSRTGIYVSSAPGILIQNNYCYKNLKQNGIYVHNSPNSVIEQNIVYNNKAAYAYDIGIRVGNGIQIDNSANTSVIRNNCYGNEGNGIILSHCDNSCIDNNTLANNYIAGINIAFSWNSSITNNYLFGNSLVLEDVVYYTIEEVEEYMYDSPDYLLSLKILNNYVDNKPIGVYKNLVNETILTTNDNQMFFINCSNLRLIGLHFGSFNGVNLYFCGDPYIENCRLSRGTFNGLMLYYCDNASLINNKCNENKQFGIGCFYSDNTLYINNSVSFNSKAGITDCNSINNTFIGNTFIWNGGFAGLQLWESQNNIIHNNTLNFCDRGLCAYSTTNITVTNNTFYENFINGIEFNYVINGSIFYNKIQNNQQYGFNFDQFTPLTSINITIHHNLFENNNLFGISVAHALYTFIHHNSFIDNNHDGASQAYDDGAFSLWYEEDLMEGNWWNDWISGSYSIAGPAGTVDLYPLASEPSL